MDIPALLPDGQRDTVLHGMSDDERTWYFRSAWNVAALNCTGEQYKPILDGYGTFLKSNRRTLDKVNDSIDRAYREKFGRGRNAIKAREKVMTSVYNFFTLPPVRQPFCKAAMDVASDALLNPKMDAAAFASAELPKMMAPFNAFFDDYQQYQTNSAAWDAKYGVQYGASQPGYVAVQQARAAAQPTPQAGVSGPETTTAQPLQASGAVTDPTSGATIPVVPVKPEQQSNPVVQPIPKDQPKGSSQK
ncbi:hypothetical protein GRI58_01470 [Porphyrobacter algicida]|uniref:Uncharacterized protein n=2 Tax=Qipengyuania algicida TaxID=1836209 RepID=A0A845ADM3_9SPHN|nr:hypothetical protein [Qipengyuania algicida]